MNRGSWKERDVARAGYTPSWLEDIAGGIEVAGEYIGDAITSTYEAITPWNDDCGFLAINCW